MTYRVITATGEHEFTGSPSQILGEMSTLDFEGDLNGYIDRVRDRVITGFEFRMVETDCPLQFLQELEKLGFIKMEKLGG